ncbi:MAG: Mobile element protein, partial [uncultured Microvirga sp.]
ARPLPASVRPLRVAPGPADAASLPHGGLRGDWRGSGRDPLRPHEDGGDRRGRGRPHRLQPLAPGARRALRLPAKGLPA